MTSKAKIITILAALLLVAALSWYGWRTVGQGPAGEGPGGMGRPGGMPPAPVSSLVLTPQPVMVQESLPGRIFAIRQSQVRPQVNGLITERLFVEGEKVEKGEQLYQIDDARYEAALSSAEADLNSAQANIKAVEAKANRFKELVKIDAVSRQEYDDVMAELDQAIAAVDVAQAAVEVAQVNLDYTRVYAPISGQIGRSFVSEGALVTANQEQPLAVITQLDPVYVDMQQAGSEAMRLRVQMSGHEEVPVTLLLGDDQPLSYAEKGKLKFSEVTVDQTTGSVTLRAIMPNPDGLLLPGMFVRAVLNFGQETALLVPQRATTRSPEGTLVVWVVGEENKAAPRNIKVSGTYQDNWIVREGLVAGEQLIIEGYQKIAPGMTVMPSPWRKAGLADQAPLRRIRARRQNRSRKDLKILRRHKIR